MIECLKMHKDNFDYCLGELIRESEAKDKEIERLKEQLKYTVPVVEHNKTITKHLNEIERLNNIINKTIKYCEESSMTLKSHYFEDVIKILKGEK